MGESVLEAKQLGFAIHQGDHVACEAGLQACVLVQVSQNDLQHIICRLTLAGLCAKACEL